MTHPKELWVAPRAAGDETGAREHPYTSISRAISNASPGQTIRIAAGVYPGDITIQQSGTMDRPITVAAEAGAEVIIDAGCWYLYDVSDVVITGLTFRNAPGGAISVVGACTRNSLSGLRFTNCSRTTRPSCTLFFGGSGAHSNVVQDCVFEHDEHQRDVPEDVDQASVAVMISEGDAEEGGTNEGFVLRRNTFLNYDFGVMVGTRDSADAQHGHLLEFNRFDHCAGDALTIKCGDTTVRANRFTDTGRTAIALLAGTMSMIVANRIESSTTGISVCGSDHTIAGNLFNGCTHAAVRVGRSDRSDLRPASMALIDQNTMVSCAIDSDAPVVFREKGSSCVVQRNLFARGGQPYAAVSTDPEAPLPSHFEGNGSCDRGDMVEGCTRAEATFAAAADGDYSNQSGYGAEGWVLRGAGEPALGELDTDEAERYRVMLEEGADRAREAADSVEDLIGDVDRDHLLGQGLFYGDPKDGDHPADS